MLLNGRKDGSRFRAELFLTPIAGDDGCRHVVAIQRSRPDNAAGGHGLGAAEEQFQSLANNLTEAVLIYRDKQPLFANERLSRAVRLFRHGGRHCEDQPADESAAGRPSRRRSRAQTESNPAIRSPIYCEALRTDGAPLHLAMRSHAIAWRGGRGNDADDQSRRAAAYSSRASPPARRRRALDLGRRRKAPLPAAARYRRPTTRRCFAN